MLNRHFLDFLGLLAKHGVDYLVIGGYAVAVHGFPRFTGDLDVFVATSRENARHMLEVFADFGFASLKLTEDDLLEPDTVIEVGHEPLKIQVLTGIDGISFERCRADRMMVAAGGLQIPFIGLDSLLVNKAASNRAKDQIDFAELTRLQGLRGRPGGGPTGE